jgi:hypothetical protein
MVSSVPPTVPRVDMLIGLPVVASYVESESGSDASEDPSPLSALTLYMKFELSSSPESM